MNNFLRFTSQGNNKTIIIKSFNLIKDNNLRYVYSVVPLTNLFLSDLFQNPYKGDLVLPDVKCYVDRVVFVSIF